MSTCDFHAGSSGERPTRRTARGRRPAPPILLALSALALVPWSVWLVGSLPCRYLTQHWGIAWSGFDFGLAAALSLTSIAALRRWSWVDRAATAAATLLVTDAWFDIVTSRGAGAMALASVEAVAAELPVAFLCLELSRRQPGESAGKGRATTARPSPRLRERLLTRASLGRRA